MSQVCTLPNVACTFLTMHLTNSIIYGNRLLHRRKVMIIDRGDAILSLDPVSSLHIIYNIPKYYYLARRRHGSLMSRLTQCGW